MRVLACSIPVRRGVQRVVAVGVEGDQVALGRPVESGRGPHPVLLAGRRRTDADRPDRPGPIDRLGDRLPASAPQERQRSRLRAVGPRDQVARDGFGGHGRGSPGDLPWPRRGPRLSIGVIPGNQSYRCGSIILGPAGRGKCLDVVHRRARRRNRVLSRENPLRASVGSTEAANEVVARFGVVGPNRAISPGNGRRRSQCSIIIDRLIRSSDRRPNAS